MPTGIYVRTEETRAKISAAGMGRIVSLETRLKLSIAGKGNTNGPKHQTPETRAKMSVAAKKRPKGCAHPNWKGGIVVAARRHKAKRRTLAFHPLNSPFIGCEAHHINNNDVIYMLKKIHRSIKHNVFTGYNMDKMNVLAGQYMTEDWT